jgi:hypothetical protein
MACGFGDLIFSDYLQNYKKIIFPPSVFSGINVRPFGWGASLAVAHLPDFSLSFDRINTFPAKTEGGNEAFHPILIWEEGLPSCSPLPMV